MAMHHKPLQAREPAMVISAGAAVLRAAMPFALAMGWIQMTPEQLEAFWPFAAAALPVIDMGVGYLIRRKVSPAP